jgi:CRISPR/Cas system-associated exonuclease Cas4 (RecB family)
MSKEMNNLPEGFIFSQSSLQDYMDCARRFELRYIRQLAWPAVESEPVLENERRQREGQTFHRLIQQHLLGISVEKLERMATSPDLLRWWHNYLDARLGLDGCSLYTELSLSIPLAEFRLTAKYDLLAVRPGHKAIIYDWKTNQKRPRDEWMAARMQTRVYHALVVEAGSHLNGNLPFEPGQVEMIYWYSNHPSEPTRLPYDQKQYQRDQDALLKLVTEINTLPDFPRTDEKVKCGYCKYRSYCDQGIRAGEGPDEVSAMDNIVLDLEQIQEIEF